MKAWQIKYEPIFSACTWLKRIRMGQCSHDISWETRHLPGTQRRYRFHRQGPKQNLQFHRQAILPNLLLLKYKQSHGEDREQRGDTVQEVAQTRQTSLGIKYSWCVKPNVLYIDIVHG